VPFLHNSTIFKEDKMFSLAPKEDKFFDMFIEYAVINNNVALLLKDFANDMSNPEEKYQKVKKEEQEGDMMLHKVQEELAKSFITPIDREDIYLIGNSLDDIADLIETTASRFIMFNLSSVRQEALLFCDYIAASTKELINLMKEFKIMNKSKVLPQKIVEINRIEDDGDILFRRAVRELFDGRTPELEIIIWKEIYERLENALNACEDLANIIEGVVMKHA
jgi:uncharacterized protein Yka (UPF0111/DUF47 family)